MGGGFSGFDIRYEDLFGSGLDDLFSNLFGGEEEEADLVKQEVKVSLFVKNTFPNGL